MRAFASPEDDRESEEERAPRSDPAEQAADRVAERLLDAGLTGVPYDFSTVRVTHDEAAVRAAGAYAYTLGREIVLGDRAARQSPGPLVAGARPGRILAHELGHVVADAARPGPAVVRRLIVPEDVSAQLIGQSMTTVGPVGTPGGPAPAGTTVVIVAWDNTAPTARVRVPAAPGRPVAVVDVDKTLLRPARPGTPGIAPYSAGVAAQASTVDRGRAAIAAELARPGGPRPGEIPRLTGLQQTREETLNRRLIQETMFNRFDPVIKQWTDFYNAQFSYTGAARLDPNLVKAMLFEESQLGTAGQHLLPAPSGPIGRKTIFNLGQVIDSSGPALLIMMQEMQPALITSHQLTNLRADLVVAQARHRTLSAQATRTPAEDAELAALAAQSQPAGIWEAFFWSYRAAGAPTGFSDAVREFFTPALGLVSRGMDYEFWIRTAIRWLFHKRQNVSSWAEAIRAYNGGGPAASHYRDAVIGRRDAAVAAPAATPFVPPRI